MKGYEAVPAALRERDTWIHYRILDRNGRRTKVPYRIDGAFASSVNPDDWSGFDAAVAALPGSGADGLGIVLGEGLVGVDLDHVISDNPQEGYKYTKLLDKYILAEALDIVIGLNSYAEISPSGDGLHILCFGSLPEGGNRKGFVEMYDKGRYFTFTGNALKDYDRVEERTEILAQIHSHFIGPKPARPAAPTNFAAPENPTAQMKETDDELLRRAFESKSGRKIKDLYSGSTAGYTSQSEADMALLNHLAFWTGGDEARMDRLFRASGLMRPKWDEKRGAETYGERAIRTARENCTEHFSPAKQKTAHKPAPLEPKSVCDLMKADIAPVQWLIPGVLPSGLALLASPPKYGKSWMVLDLCLALSAGESFMNWKTEQCETLYFALEDSDRRLKERISKLLGDRPVPNGFSYITESQSLEAGLDKALDDYLTDHPHTKLVVIDTLQKIRGSGSDQVYSTDYRDMAALKNVADKHNVCILLIHHLRKSSDDSDAFNRISGSNGIFGAADTAWVLTRDSRTNKHTQLSITGRDVTQSEQVLWFNESLCRWYRKGTLEQAVRETEMEEYNLDPLVAEIVDIVEDAGGSWTGRTTALYDAVSITAKSGMSATSFGMRLRKLAPKLALYSGISFTPPSRHGGELTLFKNHCA